jgi:hypothetical protein
VKNKEKSMRRISMRAQKSQEENKRKTKEKNKRRADIEKEGNVARKNRKMRSETERLR